MPAEAFCLSTPSEISAQNRSQCNQWRRHPWLWLLLLGTSLCAVAASAQTCQSATDMSADVQSALRATAGRYFEMAAHGDTATLRQNSIPAGAANFPALEGVLKETPTTFAGAKATVRPPFLLIANGPEPLTRAD